MIPAALRQPAEQPRVPVKRRRVVRRVQPRLQALVLVLSCTVIALAFTGLQSVTVRLGYEQTVLRAERAELERVNGRLKLQVATLKSPARVEAEALRAGMVHPETWRLVAVRPAAQVAAPVAATDEPTGIFARLVQALAGTLRPVEAGGHR